MTNAALQKRLTKLEAEVKTLKTAMCQTARAHLRAEILKGLNSGPAAPIDKQYWKELKELKGLAQKAHKAKQAKRLPKWLQASLKDVEEGRVSGPFDTVEELMADLNGPGR